MYIAKPPIGEALAHYGKGHKDGGRSGRYPWGSGDEPYQHAGDFMARIAQLRKDGFTWTDPETGEVFKGDTAIAKGVFNMSTKELRTQIGLANDEQRMARVSQAKKYREEGMSTSAIGRKMGVNESTVRGWFDQEAEEKMMQATNTAEFLKKFVDENGMTDVGTGIAKELGVSDAKMDQALYLLEREGYNVYGGGVAQQTNPGQQTNLKVLCPPGFENKDIYSYDVHYVTDYTSHDDGETFDPKFVYPKSMDSNRLAIRYADDVGSDGIKGIDKDGVLEIRRGVKDLDLGEGVQYSQVRILVDNDHYIKGMAVYSDTVPEGYDCVFNTNKGSEKSKMEVLKGISDNPENPFGSLIKSGVNEPGEKGQGGQSYYIDENGKKQLSLINKRSNEGDWSDWSATLPSQFLSKQPLELINQQLNLTMANKREEMDTIESLTNPVLKKKMLMDFADECDSSAVHLQAASLPRQGYHVILPINSLKDNEIYAPNYKDGEQVALVRYPHGGLFEIPICTVNNKNAEGRKVLGNNPMDAVGITAKTASILSGADFDGDTVMVIPTGGKVNIAHKNPLKELEGFDPKVEYGGKKVVINGEDHYYRNGAEYKIMKNTNIEMGKISNLITDMTLFGANDQELARAVKHSMVVIDAAKHKLNYQASYEDNGIRELKNKYQGHIDENGKFRTGAGSIISRAKSKEEVAKRVGMPVIDPETGEKSWKTAPDSKLYYDVKKVNKRTGEETIVTKMRTQDSTKMEETKDAYTLVSKYRNVKELAYAQYANDCKALGNEARKKALAIQNPTADPIAKVKYSKEVESLKSKLLIAEKNAPKERQAQVLTTRAMEAIKRDNPTLSAKDKGKISQQLLTKYRTQLGASKKRIVITDNEWTAIQSNAVGSTLLKKIFANADEDSVKQRAMPKAKVGLSASQEARIKALAAAGYTTEQIAREYNLSTTTISKYIHA